eukprot:115019-Amphidinium_carterae.1
MSLQKSMICKSSRKVAGPMLYQQGISAYMPRARDLTRVCKSLNQLMTKGFCLCMGLADTVEVEILEVYYRDKKFGDKGLWEDLSRKPTQKVRIVKSSLL